MNDSEYKRMQIQFPTMVKAIRGRVIDECIHAIDSESIITNPRARRNAVQAIKGLKNDDK